MSSFRFRDNVPFSLDFSQENDFSKQTPSSLGPPSDSSCPSFTIVSPTPRAFTFPINTNLMPFDYPRTPSPTSSVNSTSSTQYSPSSASTGYSPSSIHDSPVTPYTPSPSPLGRPSSAQTAEHLPKKGDDDYVKRPENAFILFRRYRCEERQRVLDESGCGNGRKPRQADLSKSISEEWKGLAPGERLIWEALAKEKKKEHALLHPGYVFRPQRKPKASGAKTKSKKTPRSARGVQDFDSDSESQPARPSLRGRRSSSAPPPSRIQLPNLFVPSDSPLDSSFLPMISRRNAPSTDMQPFDFIPTHQSLESFGQYILPSVQETGSSLTSLLPHQITFPISRSNTPNAGNLSLVNLQASVHYEEVNASYNEHYDGHFQQAQPTHQPLTAYHLSMPSQYGQEYCDASPYNSEGSHPSPPSSDSDHQSQYGESSWLNAEDPLSIEDLDHNTVSVIDLSLERFNQNPNACDDVDLHGTMYLELCEDMDIEMQEGAYEFTPGSVLAHHAHSSNAERRDREELWASLSHYEMGSASM